MGRRAVAVAGPEMTRAFYDGDRFARNGALPGFVLDTLFGRGAVHTLDGAAHRARKAMLTDVLHRDRPGDLVALVARGWDDAAVRWQDSGASVVLHTASAEVIFAAACEWMGVPLKPEETAEKAGWMTAMVDGLAPTGPRHLRARRARARAETWIAGLVELSRERGGRFSTRWDAVVEHIGADGRPLTPRVAAVEVLNILRPATAVSWFVAFGAHAFENWPEHREAMSDSAFATSYAHELRRSYPFVPMLGALARTDQSLGGVSVAEGELVLLDVYGQLHDERWWDSPQTFAPERFRGRPIDPYTLIPQGGGDTRTGHRCPGEDLTVEILRALLPRLAALRYRVPRQDTRISLRRIPALPRSGMRIEDVSVSTR